MQTRTAEICPRFDSAAVDHRDTYALGKAEHQAGNPRYLCAKFGHLSAKHFLTNHRWCDADSDRWHAHRQNSHKILDDLRKWQFTRLEIAQRMSVDTQAWPSLSDREFLAAVAETATGLPRWDDRSEPRATQPSPVQDDPSVQFLQHMLLRSASSSAGALTVVAAPHAAQTGQGTAVALTAPPTMDQTHHGFQFKPPAKRSPTKKIKLKPRGAKRGRAGDPVGEALAVSPNTFAQIALTPGASPVKLPMTTPSMGKSPSTSLHGNTVGLPAHALQSRLHEAEASLKSRIEERKFVWEQLGRIDTSVSDLKRSSCASNSLMGTLLKKVAGVSEQQLEHLVQEAKELALAELPRVWTRRLSSD